MSSAAVLIDGEHREQQSVLREMSAIAQDDVADVADTLAVDEHAPGATGFAAARAGGVDLERLPVFEQKSPRPPPDRPTMRASRMCSVRWRYSPCTGTK